MKDNFYREPKSIDEWAEIICFEDKKERDVKAKKKIAISNKKLSKKY